LRKTIQFLTEYKCRAKKKEEVKNNIQMFELYAENVFVGRRG